VKPEEAIETLTEYTTGRNPWSITELPEASKLGIEALKRELLFRERVPKKEWSLLPGETKD